MKKTINKIFYTTIAVIFASPEIVMAQGGAVAPPSGHTPTPNQFNSPIGFSSFREIIVAIVNVVVRVGSILVLLAIIYAGFLFVTAQGSEDKIKTAKKTFTYVIIGSIILLGAQQLANVVANTAGQFSGR
jgi:hypothetical protein